MLLLLWLWLILWLWLRLLLLLLLWLLILLLWLRQLLRLITERCKQCLALLQQSSIDCHCLVVSCREQSRRTSHCIRWLTNRPDAAFTLTTVAAANAAATVDVDAALY